ncbi:MAG: hypothetical protein CM15mP92_0130 [Halieaceae bacterium]|nr:MAG: hypothetical protein CM15mP92_0130 [Halieaceae bacterium]
MIVLAYRNTCPHCDGDEVELITMGMILLTLQILL